MAIELPRELRQQLVQSIERYCRDELDHPVGNIAAAALLNYMLAEIGPSIYNQAIADAQERLQQRVQELDIELHEDEQRYWPQFDAARAKAGGGGRGGRR